MFKKIMLTISLSLMLFACSANNRLIGKWQNIRIYTTEESVLENYAEVLGIDLNEMLDEDKEALVSLLKSSIYDLEVDNGTIVEFKKDGTYELSTGETDSYKANETTLTMTEDKYRIKGEWSIDKGILTIKVQGVYYEYKRAK